LRDDYIYVSPSVNQIMNDTVCSKAATSDDKWHSSQDTLVVVTFSNNNSNTSDDPHNFVSLNTSKVREILDSLSQHSLGSEYTDKESNSNLGKGKIPQGVITMAIEAQIIGILNLIWMP